MVICKKEKKNHKRETKSTFSNNTQFDFHTFDQLEWATWKSTIRLQKVSNEVLFCFEHFFFILMFYLIYSTLILYFYYAVFFLREEGGIIKTKMCNASSIVYRNAHVVGDVWIAHFRQVQVNANIQKIHETNKGIFSLRGSLTSNCDRDKPAEVEKNCEKCHFFLFVRLKISQSILNVQQDKEIMCHYFARNNPKRTILIFLGFQTNILH